MNSSGFRRNVYLIIFTGSLFLITYYSTAQSRELNRQNQSWFSVNTTAKITDRWAVITDLHTRHKEFMGHNNFNFVRAGIQYSFSKNFSVAAGYGHLWSYPSIKEWNTITHESRIYQQLLYTSNWKKISLLHRIRNEQRWQQKIVNDQYTGQKRFTNRIRYLFSLNIPVFKKKNLPSLSLADELALQMGKDVIYNTYEQNRFFIGIKQQISPSLSFDTGYMVVYQQKKSGYQYDLNNTFRLFFYYSPHIGKKHKA